MDYRPEGDARRKLASELREKYEAGRSIRALAEDVGRSYCFVHCLLEPGHLCRPFRRGIDELPDEELDTAIVAASGIGRQPARSGRPERRVARVRHRGRGHVALARTGRRVSSTTGS